MTNTNKKMRKVTAAAMSALMAVGTVSAAMPSMTAKASDLGLDNYAKLLQYSLYFYDANMCGSNVGEDSAFTWRDDCHTGDLIPGGFHDAGDAIKCGQAAGFAASTIGWTFYEYRDQFEKSGTAQHYQKIMDYFCDFFKASVTMSNGEVTSIVYEVGDSGRDHSFWAAPETMYSRDSSETYRSSNSGGDTAAQYAATLAQNYINFGNQEDLDYAIAMYNFADKNRSVAGNGNIYGFEGTQDDMSWAAGWLYIATGEQKYLTESNKYTTCYNSWTDDYCWANSWLGAAIINAEITGNWSTVTNYIGGVVGANQNRYYVMNSWGSARHNTLMQLCALVTSKYEASGVNYNAWAKQQMNYILGDNDANVCLVVGYNDVSATSPHHRAASCLTISPDWHEWNNWNGNYAVTNGHTLYGALCGGPTSSSFTTYHDDAKDATSNEVALDYQCGLVGAAAGLYAAYNTGSVVASIGDGVNVYPSEIAAASGNVVIPETTKPTTTTTTKATTTTTTTTTKATTTTTTTKATTTTPKPTTTTTKATTTTTKATTKPVTGGNAITLTNVKLGETYDISQYKNISRIDFTFNQTPPYGMNGCAVLGNWEFQQNYEAKDLVGTTLTVIPNKDYNTMTLHKWYGEAELTSIVIYTGSAAPATTTKATTTTTTTTTKATTTTTTTKATTTTPKPTTTTTKTTTTTTTTKATTTTPKPTTTTTKTTTTTTTTTPKPTTTTTKATTTTPKPTTTTTKATTTTVAPSNSKTIVLKDVTFGNSYSLAKYDYNAIQKIEVKLSGDVKYGFGGALVLGNWASQMSYGHTDMQNGTVTFEITNPQDKFTLFQYWGSMNLDSVILYLK